MPWSLTAEAGVCCVSAQQALALSFLNHGGVYSRVPRPNLITFSNPVDLRCLTPLDLEKKRVSFSAEGRSTQRFVVVIGCG